MKHALKQMQYIFAVRYEAPSTELNLKTKYFAADFLTPAYRWCSTNSCGANRFLQYAINLVFIYFAESTTERSLVENIKGNKKKERKFGQ